MFSVHPRPSGLKQTEALFPHLHYRHELMPHVRMAHSKPSRPFFCHQLQDAAPLRALKPLHEISASPKRLGRRVFRLGSVPPSLRSRWRSSSAPRYLPESAFVLNWTLSQLKTPANLTIERLQSPPTHTVKLLCPLLYSCQHNHFSTVQHALQHTFSP